MIEVIGLDEKDIDKAIVDRYGMPLRAPRDMKDGEIFWFGFSSWCGIGDKLYGEPPQGEMVDPDQGLQLILDTENYDAALLKAKES